MRKVYQLFMLLALFLTSASAFGQSGKISGTVFNLETQKPLEFVQVLDLNSGQGSLTDIDGKYELKDLKAGAYKLRFTHVGYKEYEVYVNLKEGEQRTINVQLEQHVYRLDEFVIKGSMKPEQTYVKNIATRNEIELEAARDVGDYLRMVPNVSGIRKGAVNIDPVVRGFKSSQLNILVNGGITVEGGCPNRMDPTVAHIDMDAIEAIEVIKGPYALRYGPSFGGVINMITTNPQPYEKFEVHAKAIKGYESNWNLNKEHITVLGGNSKIFFALEGNRMNSGNYVAGNGDEVRSSFRKFGYSAKLGFQPFKHHKFLFSYSESYGRDVMFTALPMDERTDDTRIYSFDYTARDLSKYVASVDVKAFFSDVDHLMDNKQRSFSDTVAAEAYIEADRLGYRAEVGLNILHGHLFLGTDWVNTKKDGARDKYIIGQPPMMGNLMIKPEKLWNEAEIDNKGFFGEYKRTIKQLDIVGSARIDINTASSNPIVLKGMKKPDGTVPELLNIQETSSEYTNVSFSAGAKYHFNKRFAASLAIGRGVRSPDMLERFIISLPVGFDNYEYMGNPLLEPETNNEVDLTFTYQHPKYGGLEVNGFYSYVQNFITGRVKAGQLPLTQKVFGVKEFYNADIARLRGFEFGYNSPHYLPWGVKVSMAYTKSSIDETQQYVYDATGNATDVIDLENDPLPEMPPMETQLQFHYKMFKGKLIPRLQLRYVSAQDNVSESYYEQTTPSFTVLNFGLSYKHNSVVTLSCGVNNLFDHAYVEHLNRRVVGTKTRLYEPGRVVYVNMILNL